MTDDNSRKPLIQPEMLVGISAILIGVCALGVSLYEASLMRQEQRAAVIPLMELGRSYLRGEGEASAGEWRLLLHAENVGIGLAGVMDFHVTVDGIEKPSWGAAMQALTKRDDPITYAQSTINGRTIPPERVVTMFELSDTELVKEIIDEFDRLDYEACFCSIFDECWTTSYSTFGAANAVEACHRSADSFEE
jgi:hypothetical protein